MKNTILIIMLVLLSTMAFAVEGEQISHDLNDQHLNEDDNEEIPEVPVEDEEESSGPPEFRDNPDRVAFDARDFNYHSTGNTVENDDDENDNNDYIRRELEDYPVTNTMVVDSGRDTRTSGDSMIVVESQTNAPSFNQVKSNGFFDWFIDFFTN